MGGGYAWFTMNKEVTVSGLQVQATSDNGLVISGDAKTTWLTAWNVGMTSSVSLAPTSTNANASSLAWVSAKSHDFNDEDSEQTAEGAYTDLSLTYSAPSPANGDFGTGEGLGRDSTSGFDYVLLKKLFIKASGTEALGETLKISDVTATVTANGDETDQLSRSLRVLVVVNNAQSFIYAPIENYDSTIKWKNTTTLTLVPTGTASTTSVTSIPNTDAGAIPVDIYIYFEGEDDACKSANIQGITLDDISIRAQFTTQAAQQTTGG